VCSCVVDAGRDQYLQACSIGRKHLNHGRDFTRGSNGDTDTSIDIGCLLYLGMHLNLITHVCTLKSRNPLAAQCRSQAKSGRFILVSEKYCIEYGA
jgi:hypothetical protein